MEYINRPINASHFPSAFFLTTHPYSSIISKSTALPICQGDEMWGEEMIFDLPSVYFEDRKHFEYLYQADGTRTYSVDDQFNKNVMKKYDKCQWKEISGQCIITQINDDFYHANHTVVNFEFKPVLYKQTAADLNQSLKINFFNPTYQFILDANIQVSNQYQCIHRILLSGDDCSVKDYFDFPELKNIIYQQEEKDE